MPEYPLVPDPRADIVAGSADFKAYLEKMPELYLKPEVPDIVREHIRIAQRVLEHSYFVYEFIDIALTQVIIGLEKSLRLKYREVEKKDDEELTFFQLSKWATSNNFFELADQSILDIYRKVRNGKVHSPKNSLGGTLYLQRILEPIGFINDLYEDIPLRVARKEVWTSLMKDVVDVFKEGATLTFDGNNLFFVRNICVTFVNNKHSSPKYYFSMVILTDPQSHSSQHLLATENLVALNVALNKTKRTMTGTEADTNRTFTISALDNLGMAAMKIWENQINEIHRKEDGEHAMPIDILAASSVQVRAEKLHTKALFNFYRN